jgi:hypothetical protein
MENLAALRNYGMKNHLSSLQFGAVHAFAFFLDFSLALKNFYFRFSIFNKNGNINSFLMLGCWHGQLEALLWSFVKAGIELFGQINGCGVTNGSFEGKDPFRTGQLLLC